MRKRFGLYFASGAMALVVSVSRSDAQVIPPMQEVVMPPWNAQQIFDPTALPDLADVDTREDVAPEDMPVKSRVYPEYQPRGVRAGAWMFDPSLTAGGFYDSNVFSSNTNKESDVAGQVGAGLGAHTLWERHGIDIRAMTLSTDYASHHGLNQTDASVRASGHYDIDHSMQILGAFQAAYLHEGVGTLSSPTGAVQPTPYGLWSGDLTLRKEFGRFTGSVGGRVDSYNFGHTVAQNGAAIDQSARSGQIYVEHGRLDYAISGKTSWFTAAATNQRDLNGSPGQPLSSTGYRVLSGFALQLTHLIWGEIGAGYMAQRFDADTIGTIRGPTYRARLNWSPSRLVDVHFVAEQLVTEAADTSSTGILANALQLGFDYEFRPNVVLSAAGTYEKDSFKGQDRQDNVYAIDAQLKYKLNNVTSLSFMYRFTRRDSDNSTFSYDKHQVGLNAAAHF